MILKCIAVDDEPPALALISEYASRIPALQLLHTFDDALSARSFLSNANIDLLFVDVDMPDISGLDLVRSLEKEIMVIFTTAHKKFAIDGYELDAIDYLLKPVNFERFQKAVKKALDFYAFKNQPAGNSGESLFVYSEYRMLKINTGDIEYIESLKDYIRIHLTDTKPVLTLMTMKAVLEKLPEDKFKRIHRSYIIPLHKIHSVGSNNLRLNSGVELPFGDTYAEFIKEWKKNV